MTIDGGELDGLRQQLTAILVQVATLAQTVAGLRDDIARQGAGHADHEARLRALEATDPAAHGTLLERHDSRIETLEATRWKQVGALAAVTFVGGSGGVCLTLVVQALQHRG